MIRYTIPAGNALKGLWNCTLNCKLKTEIRKLSANDRLLLNDIFRHIAYKLSEFVKGDGYKGDKVVCFEIQHDIDGIEYTIAVNVNLNEDSTGFFAVVEFDDGREPLIAHNLDELVKIRR